MQQVKDDITTEWVSCGRLGRAIGLKGECTVFWNSDECPYEIGSVLFISSDDGTQHEQYKIAALRAQGRFDVLRFEGISDRSQAAAFTGRELVRPASSLPKLPKDQYYCYQILGLKVKAENGHDLGTIVRIFTAGENDVYEVLPEGAAKGEEILFPAIKDVVISVNLDAGHMVVRPMEGMFD
ncbi:MAG: ribosome maturation factor RimM [Pseudomonadota bacterium]